MHSQSPTAAEHELERRLLAATGSRRHASHPESAVDASWRAGWQGLGELLEAAEPPGLPPTLPTPAAASRTDIRLYLALAAGLAGLLALPLAWPRVQLVSPPAATAQARAGKAAGETASDPLPAAAAERSEQLLAWDDPWNERVELVYREVTQMRHQWQQGDSRLDAAAQRMEQMAAELRGEWHVDGG